jgi:predicted phage gp36 major capsid-like protein
MSHDVATDIASFANAQNLASFYTTDLTGVITTLRTRPVEFSSYFPGSISGTSHQNQLVIGDFSNYLIASRAGMSIELIPHLIGLTSNRPTGQRGCFAWARAGADSINDLAFRILNQT